MDIKWAQLSEICTDNCISLVKRRQRDQFFIQVEKKKNTSIGVDGTSTGALLPGEANPTHTQTMEFFHDD